MLRRLAGIAAAAAPLLAAGGCGDGSGSGHAARVAPRLQFSDAAAAAGVAAAGRSYAAAAADYDRDGWPDLAVSAHGVVQLFRNRGGRFVYVSGTMGFDAADTHGLSWVDVDRDGWLDLLVAVGANQGQGRGDNQIYRNQRGESLVLDPAPPPVLRDPAGRGRCMVSVDLDLDGRLDVAVVNLVQQGRWSRLARATAGGGYQPAGEALGIATIAAECLTVVHLDGSRTPTLIGYGGGSDSGRAFRPGAGGALVDVTAELGIPPSPHLIYGVAVGDYDNDGDLDLYFVRGHHVPPAVAALDGGVGFRLLYHGAGDRSQFRFRCEDDFVADLMLGFNRPPAAVHLGAAGEHPRSIPWLVGRHDPTLDGAPAGERADPGLYLWRSGRDEYTLMLAGAARRFETASGTLRGERGPCRLVDVPRELRRRWRATPNLLLRNDAGGFEDVTEAAGAGDPGSGRDALFFDPDNDGDLDLFVVNGGLAFEQQPDVLLGNRGDGTFVDVSGRAGIAGPSRGRGASVTVLDYDRDGAVDLFVTNGEGPPLGNEGTYSLWHNETTPRGRWITVDLVGDAGNPAAIGASVLAHFGGRRLRVERTSTSGRYSTSVLPLHLGLGQSSEARLEVSWPSGTIVQATATAGERLVLTEREAGRPP